MVTLTFLRNEWILVLGLATVIRAISFCVRHMHCRVRFGLLVGSCTMPRTPVRHRGGTIYSVRGRQNGKSGYGAVTSTAAMCSSTTLSSEAMQHLQNLYWKSRRQLFTDWPRNFLCHMLCKLLQASRTHCVCISVFTRCHNMQASNSIHALH